MLHNNAASATRPTRMAPPKKTPLHNDAWATGATDCQPNMFRSGLAAVSARSWFPIFVFSVVWFFPWILSLAIDWEQSRRPSGIVSGLKAAPGDPLLILNSETSDPWNASDVCTYKVLVYTSRFIPFVPSYLLCVRLIIQRTFFCFCIHRAFASLLLYTL